MGASSDTFVKYPRTPHLLGSRGTDDDKHLSPGESADILADPSLVVVEKLEPPTWVEAHSLTLVAGPRVP